MSKEQPAVGSPAWWLRKAGHFRQWPAGHPRTHNAAAAGPRHAAGAAEAVKHFR